MTDKEHAKYCKLIEGFYDGKKLRDSEYNQLTKLHGLNMERVNKIVTKGANE